MEDYNIYNDLQDDVTEEIPLREINIPPIETHDFPDFKLFKDCLDIVDDEGNIIA